MAVRNRKGTRTENMWLSEPSELKVKENKKRKG